MDFSLRRINGENIHYTESDTESEIQLIFTPGGFNPGLWNNQLQYFSKNYKTVAFQPTESYRNFKGEKKALKAILDQEKIENSVLVSNIAGNAVISQLSDHESVETTVMTGFGNRKMPERKIYRAFWFLARRNPKILRKSLFSKYTDYRILKNFMRDVEIPSYSDLESFMSRDMVEGSQLSLIINAEDDRFSDLAEARKMNTRLSRINRAGTFSFYEKPQDYSKALNDFLEIVKKRVQEKKIKQSAEENRSLVEFSGRGKKAMEVKK